MSRPPAADEAPRLAVLGTTPDGELRAIAGFPDSIWAEVGHPRRALRVLTDVVGRLPPPRFPEESTPHALTAGALVDELRRLLEALRTSSTRTR